MFWKELLRPSPNEKETKLSKATTIKLTFKLSEQSTYKLPKTVIQDGKIILVPDGQSKPDWKQMINTFMYFILLTSYEQAIESTWG